MAKQLAGTAQNNVAMVCVEKCQLEFGVELIMVLIESKYNVVENEMIKQADTETVKLWLRKTTATALRDTLNEIIDEIARMETTQF